MGLKKYDYLLGLEYVFVKDGAVVPSDDRNFIKDVVTYRDGTIATIQNFNDEWVSAKYVNVYYNQRNICTLENYKSLSNSFPQYIINEFEWNYGGQPCTIVEYNVMDCVTSGATYITINTEKEKLLHVSVQEVCTKDINGEYKSLRRIIKEQLEGILNV